MDNLPQVNLTDHPISSWGNKVNQSISKHKVLISPDFIQRQTSRGRFLQLKRRHKAGSQELRYRGEYDPDKGYSMFDIVRVMPGKDYTDEDENLIAATPGVWLCVVSVPSLTFTNNFGGDAVAFKRYLRQEDVDYFPQWPEPADKATLDDPDGRYWELISLLPMEMTTCENGEQKTVYVDATEKPEDTEEDE